MDNARRPIQFTIRHLLVATFVAAISLGILRWIIDGAQGFVTIFVVTCFCVLPIAAAIVVATEVWSLLFRRS